MELSEFDFSGFKTPQLVFTAAARLARDHGFEYLLYAMTRQTVHGADEILFSTYPAEWMPHYLAHGYRDCDPLLQHSMRSNVHVLWTPMLFDSSIKSKLMYNEAGEIGIRDGIAVPIHGADGAMACVSFSCPQKMHSLNTLHIGELYIVANFMHDAIIKLITCSQKCIRLTAREKETMRWMSEGKTSWEISTILKISERTALFHLTNAMEKLHAVNRSQAIAKAISLKLL